MNIYGTKNFDVWEYLKSALKAEVNMNLSEILGSLEGLKGYRPYA